MTLIKFIEIMAILVGAFSGFIEARRKRMDLVGVFTVAFIAAFGGGTLRDILLDRRPLFWVTHQEYAILIFVLALIASPLIRTLRHMVSERLIVIADAVGLGLFSIAGVSAALDADMPLFIASMMGVITG
ncbi:MAG: TRIC cation channel family protein, partial [Telluria sp.]